MRQQFTSKFDWTAPGITCDECGKWTPTSELGIHTATEAICETCCDEKASTRTPINHVGILAGSAGAVVSGIAVGLMIAVCLIFSEDEIRDNVADFIAKLF
jgi:hypothetical protein